MIKPNSIIKLVLPEHAVMPMVGIFVGATITAKVIPNIEVLVVPFLAFLFLVWGFNALNGIFDFKIDKINKPKRPLPHGELTHPQVSFIFITFSTIGLALAFSISIEIFILGGVFFILGLMYSAPPIRIKMKFLGINLIGGVLYGVIPLSVGYFLASNSQVNVPLFFFIFISTAIVSSVKDFDDVIGDEVYNVKSLPAVYGIKKAAKIISASLILAVGVFLVYALLYESLEIIIATILCLFISITFAIYLIKNTKKVGKFQSRDIIYESNTTRVCILIALIMESMFGVVYL